MAISTSHWSGAVEFLDRPSKSDENRAIAPLLEGAGYKERIRDRFIFDLK
jgi:hypothetical protein